MSALSTTIQLISKDIVLSTIQSKTRGGTWVKRIDQYTYKIVNAFNDNDKNVYVVNDKGIPTSEVIAQTLRTYDFLYTNENIGAFLYDDEMCGRTFSLKDMTIKGKVKLPNGDIAGITNADFWILEKWGNDIYINEIKRLKPKTTLGYLEILRDLSRNGAALDIKVSFGKDKYTVLKAGETTDGKPIITTLRASGNFVFGSNMRFAETQFPLIPTDAFYYLVMKQVGDYNQKQNNGNGFNDGHPYYGEHTYSGSYIYYGYYKNFYN